MDGFPSGQRGQTVNLLQIASVVRIHHHPLDILLIKEYVEYNLITRGGAVWKLVGLITRRSLVRIQLPGATGFDMVSRIRGAGRGLLATLNRGTVKLIGKNNTQGQLALAA